MNSNTELDTFETALLAELREHVARHPVDLPVQAGSRRRPRLALTGAAVGVAATVAIALSLDGTTGGGSPAYAVETDAAGNTMITITVHDSTDTDSLEVALRAEGFDGEVGVGTGVFADAPQVWGPDAAEGPKGDCPSELPALQMSFTQTVKGGADVAPTEDVEFTIPAGSPLRDHRHFVVDVGPLGPATPWMPGQFITVSFEGTSPGSTCVDWVEYEFTDATGAPRTE